MRWVDPDFAIELPDGFVVRRERDPFSAFSETWQCEVTVGSWRAAHDADPGTVAQELCDAVHRSALRAMPGHVFVRSDVVRGPGRLVAGLTGVGVEPAFMACRAVVREAPLGDALRGISVSFYKYADAAGPGDLAGFLDFCERVVASVAVVPDAGAIERALDQGGKLDPLRLYPFLLTAARLDAHLEAEPLGHGLFLGFAEDHDGAARILHAGAPLLSGLEGSPLAVATLNLARAVAGGRVTIGVGTAPTGQRWMVFGPQWLAASCLFLPDLRNFAAAHVGTNDLCACAPHRDLLVVFPTGNESTRAQLAEHFDKWMREGRKPLCTGMFLLTDHGFEPLGAPIA